jgi:2-oxoglutarate ferredoxin oxidoreductase subunit delta
MEDSRKPMRHAPFWRTPLDADKQEIIVGKVNVIASRCKGCGYCIEFCPEDVLEASKDFNEKGYYPPLVKVEGRCVNCTYCETICPEFAVFCTVAERRPLRPEDMFDTRALSRRESRRRSLSPSAAPKKAATARTKRPASTGTSPGGAGE